MTNWIDRSSCGTALHVIRFCCTVPTIAFYVLTFFLICDPLTRANNVNNDFQPPGNGHLTDSMNPLVRNALSWDPPKVLGLQLGLCFACSIGWCLHCWWGYKVEPSSSLGAHIPAAILEALLGAAGVLPGLMGIYTFNWWGCRELFYGQDPENTTENSYGQAACNEYRGATYLFTIGGCLWLLGLFFNIVLCLYGAGRSVAKRDDIELHRRFRAEEQETGPRQWGANPNPPQYTSGYTNQAHGRKW